MYYLGPQIPFLVIYKLNECKFNIILWFNCYLGIYLNLMYKCTNMHKKADLLNKFIRQCTQFNRKK